MPGAPALSSPLAQQLVMSAISKYASQAAGASAGAAPTLNPQVASAIAQYLASGAAASGANASPLNQVMQQWAASNLQKSDPVTTPATGYPAAQQTALDQAASAAFQTWLKAMTNSTAPASGQAAQQAAAQSAVQAYMQTLMQDEANLLMSSIGTPPATATASATLKSDPVVAPPATVQTQSLSTQAAASSAGSTQGQSAASSAPVSASIANMSGAPQTASTSQVQATSSGPTGTTISTTDVTAWMQQVRAGSYLR